MKVHLFPLFHSIDQEKVTVGQFHFVIGRASDCDLCLPNPVVSRHHCQLIVDGDHLLVRDLSSSNGTFVNDSLVDEAMLTDGDVLGVANLFRFEVDVSGGSNRFLSRLRRDLVRRGLLASPMAANH